MNKTLRKRYNNIKDRCYNPKNKSYHRYGGRGINVCQEWLDDYNAFEIWALSNGFQENLAIDRIDNDGDYSPNNCRFVSLKENNQNRRTTTFYTINGETKNLQQWCDKYGLKRGTVVTRLQHGMPIEQALTKPVNSGRNKTELIGKRFGRLLVLDYAGDEYIGKDNNSKWRCKCDCGNFVIVGSNKLKTGHTKSCGCLQSEIAKNRMEKDNPMKTEEQRKRMIEYNPMKKKRKD